MRKTTLIGLAAGLCTVAVTAQDSRKEQDLRAIKDLCGCYEVSFKYTETFSPESDYEKKPDYAAGALELALPILEEDDKISIQHLLIINDSTVIKHWRQDWLFENRELFAYHKDNTWEFHRLPGRHVTGQWTQKVFQVDDSPRYSGSATWIHTDGKHYWENKAASPLPRREYTKRSDYNLMLRGNRQEITESGWVHEQDNDKIIREDGADDVLLAQEKGWNEYTRVADEKCQAAMEWWQDHKDFWASVRSAWETVYDREGSLTLHRKVADKPLYMYLHELEERGATAEEIAEVLAKFVATDSGASTLQGK